ncbi:MAG: hypothetical protein K6U80_00040 [Firmicutes bacterium]|nr:hypothetical protein [Bacillota bacterium]
MQNIFLMPVYQPEPYCPVVNVARKAGEWNNARFSLNLINPQMQRMTKRLGFNDFYEMVEAYFLESKLPHCDIQGNLELLCNVLLC